MITLRPEQTRPFDGTLFPTCSSCGDESGPGDNWQNNQRKKKKKTTKRKKGKKTVRQAHLAFEVGRSKDHSYDNIGPTFKADTKSL